MRKKFTFLLAVFLLCASPTATQADSLTVYNLQSIEYGQTMSVQSVHTSSSYEMIRNSLLAGETIGHFDLSELSYMEVGNLIQKVIRENPDIMYYDGGTIWSDGKIEFNYSAPTSVVQTHQQLLQAEVDQVLSSIIKPGFTDLDKVKAIHDYLALNTAYDYDNFNNETVPADSYTAYGSLVKGVAVCDGYTKAAQILLDRLDIENHYVDGYGNGELHSWNLVKLDDHYYFMDITWDDPVPNTPGRVNHAYFLVTSDLLRKDHQWIEDNWPQATSAKYHYFNEFEQTVEIDGNYYYSNSTDYNKLYKISKDGTGKVKINDARAPYFAIAGDWIYFSNYSQSGYLFKMKKDGSHLQQLNSIHSINLSISGNMLHFINQETNLPMALTVEMTQEKPVNPIGIIVPSTKTWTVTFNQEIDGTSVNPQNIIVKSAAGETISVSLALDPNDGTKLLVHPPNGGYERETNYMLTVQNVRSTTGNVLKTTTKHPFHVK